MSAWIVGKNEAGKAPTAEPAVFQTRTLAVAHLREIAEQFAQDVDDFHTTMQEDYRPESDSAVEAVELMFALGAPVNPSEGPVVFHLEDHDGWAHVFFAVETRDDWFRFPGEPEDMEPLTAARALAQWIEETELDSKTVALITEQTDRTWDHALNIKAMHSAAAYHGLDLPSLGLPERI